MVPIHTDNPEGVHSVASAVPNDVPTAHIAPVATTSPASYPTPVALIYDPDSTVYSTLPTAVVSNTFALGEEVQTKFRGMPQQ